MARTNAIDRFIGEAEASGLEVEVQRYPDGTRTAADAAAAVGCKIDQIVKSLVFMADVRPILILCSGARRVDEEKLAEYIGTEIRIAGASEVRAATGYAIGGTPPLGHTVPLKTVVDPHLMEFEEIWAAAGTPDSVFPIKPKELVKATSGAVVAVTR
jgi:prolyl-tRNA editing enzyme YbaK/EbsC (Cys-tRNA(Pro) deacylase)